MKSSSPHQSASDHRNLSHSRFFVVLQGLACGCLAVACSTQPKPTAPNSTEVYSEEVGKGITPVVVSESTVAGGYDPEPVPSTVADQPDEAKSKAAEDDDEEEMTGSEEAETDGEDAQATGTPPDSEEAEESGGADQKPPAETKPGTETAPPAPKKPAPPKSNKKSATQAG